MNKYKIRKMEFPFQTVKNAVEGVLVDHAETDGMRISERGVKEMQIVLEDHLKRVVLQAAELARHTKRKTIKREDILFALKILSAKEKG